MYIFSRLKIQADHFKITKNRGGFEVGPLPSITGFTDYSKSYEFNLYWEDNVRSEAIVRKHMFDILKNYLRYTDKDVNEALKIAKIKKFDNYFTVEIKN